MRYLLLFHSYFLKRLFRLVCISQYQYTSDILVLWLSFRVGPFAAAKPRWGGIGVVHKFTHIHKKFTIYKKILKIKVEILFVYLKIIPYLWWAGAKNI